MDGRLTTAGFLVTAVVGGLVLAPLTAASAASAKPAPKFVVSKLGIVGHTTTYDVTAKPAVVKVQVQVKDFDKKFDPTSVKLIVVEKASGTPATTFTVAARKVGRSAVVSHSRRVSPVARAPTTWPGAPETSQRSNCCQNISCDMSSLGICICQRQLPAVANTALRPRP